MLTLAAPTTPKRRMTMEEEETKTLDQRLKEKFPEATFWVIDFEKIPEEEVMGLRPAVMMRYDSNQPRNPDEMMSGIEAYLAESRTLMMEDPETNTPEFREWLMEEEYSVSEKTGRTLAIEDDWMFLSPDHILIPWLRRFREALEAHQGKDLSIIPLSKATMDENCYSDLMMAIWEMGVMEAAMEAE